MSARFIIFFSIFFSGCASNVSRDLHVSSLSILLRSEMSAFENSDRSGQCVIWPSLKFGFDYLQGQLGAFYDLKFFEEQLICGKNWRCSELLESVSAIQRQYATLKKPDCVEARDGGEKFIAPTFN